MSAKKAPGKLYGLIFDVDGVIADTEGLNARASIKVFADMFGLPGVRREDFRAGLGRGAEAYMRAAATVHGLNPTDEEIAESARMREKNFLDLLDKEPLSAFAGVLALIDEALARKDFRLAIATSSTRAMSGATLRSARVPVAKMAVVTGEDVKHKKPDPEIFLAAARRIDVEPARCVVIEDSPSGVQAASAAHCRCIAVTNTTTAENLAQADMIVDSLTRVTVGTIVELVESAREGRP